MEYPNIQDHHSRGDHKSITRVTIEIWIHNILRIQEKCGPTYLGLNPNPKKEVM